MRTFLLWCVLTMSCYSGLVAAYHLYLSSHPRRILIALDTSYPMQPVWEQARAMVQALPQRRYSEFSVITDKGRLHGWQPAPALGNLQPYAPRNFATFLDPRQSPEIAAADTVYVVTNAPDTATLRQASGREVIVLTPAAPSR